MSFASAAAAEVVGRDRELATLAEFLADPPTLPPVLLLDGEAGIGKTTLWEHALASAQPTHRVLAARPLDVEARISFATVGDLLEGTLDELEAELPPPQRRALEVALLHADPDGPPPSPQAIAFAFLSALRVLGRDRTVLVAIDDVQWLDRPSASALVYAARRLDADAIRFLLARRADDVDSELDLERAIGHDRLHLVALGPLSRGAIQHVVREQLGLVLTRPVLNRLHAGSGANPFYAVELARATVPPDGRIEPDAPIRIPDRLSGLVDARLASLPGDTELALQVAALTAAPTVANVMRLRL